MSFFDCAFRKRDRLARVTVAAESEPAAETIAAETLSLIVGVKANGWELEGCHQLDTHYATVVLFDDDPMGTAFYGVRR